MSIFNCLMALAVINALFVKIEQTSLELKKLNNSNK
jgi:hypothetical protein